MTTIETHNPLDSIKHIVSFSGGMGSFAEAKSCVDKYGKDNVLLLFADTLMEDEDLYRFKDETTKFLGCELVSLCYGQTPWELFETEKFVGNSRVDLCSRKLKRELLNNWIVANYGYTASTHVQRDNGTYCYYVNGEPITIEEPRLRAEIHLGIDYSEGHRLARVQERMRPYIYRSTLVEEGRIVPKDFSEQFGIARPRLYTLGFSHNNCGGFCVKAGLGHFKLLYEKLPERYKEHEDKELTLAKTCGTLPFLRKRTNGVTRYITLKVYREEFLEVGKAEEDKFDIGGCACAL